MNIQRKRRKNIPTGLIIVAVILVLLSVFLGASVFLRVAEIEVEGNSRYSKGVVAEASGIKLGARLYTLNPSQAELNISKKLSYADEVDVSVLYPNRVLIEITESYPIAAIFHSGDWWILDKNCRILEYGTNTEAHSYIVITGFDTEEGELGSSVRVSEEDENKLTRTMEILNAVFSAQLENSITALDITDIGNILLTYGNNITVKLGSGQNISDKLMLLAEISDKLDDSCEGTVQLGENGQAYYSKQ